MYRTVKELLQLDVFQNAKVVAGTKGLDRIVNNASLMEVPDIIPYVEANTVLITTMYPIAGESEKIGVLIPQLKEKQAAAICIKPLRYIEEIPKLLIEQADKLSFPIIELPINSNLSSCVNAILSVSLEDHIKHLQFRAQVHNNMIELLLEGAGIEILTKKLAEMVQRDIMLLDKEYMNICSAIFRKESKTWLVIKGAHGRQVDEKEMEENEGFFLFPIQAGSNLFGYIYIPGCVEQDENLRLAVEQAAMLFAAVFFKDDVESMHRRTFRDGFLRELLQGKISNENAFERKKEAFGVTFRFPIFVMVLKLITDSENQKKRFYKYLIDERFMEKQLRTFKDLRCDMVYHSDALVLLIDAEQEKQVEDLAQYLQENICKAGHFYGVVGIGISKEARTFEEIKRAYCQALSMLQVGRIIYQDSYVSTYRKNRVYELIEKIGDEELLKAYVEDKLGALLAYDEKNHTDLIETLHELIRANFNYKKAAETSFLHYNTIRYRADKIKQLGISFEQGQSLAEVVFAFDIYLWLQATNKSC